MMSILRYGTLASCLALGILVSCTFNSAANNLQQPAADYSRTPVLFVHGSGLNSQTWQQMMQYLVSIGYSREYLKAIDLVPNNGANALAAENFIAPAVETLLTEAGTAADRAGDRRPQQVNIVAHSMGAVSSRWYAAQMRPERVRTWIALAGANYGTNALCPFPSEGNSEMCPAFATSNQQNPLQVALNGTSNQPIDRTPYGLGIDAPGIGSIRPDSTRSILYLTVRIEPDDWIKPESSAAIDGAGGISIAVPSGIPIRETSPGNYLFQAQVGHDALPQHPDLIRLVAEMLAIRNRQEITR